MTQHVFEHTQEGTHRKHTGSIRGLGNWDMGPCGGSGQRKVSASPGVLARAGETKHFALIGLAHSTNIL